MKIPIFEYSQNNNQLATAIIPFGILNANSHVLVYGKSSGGYQREPDEKHFNKIKKYVLDDPNFLFPTSIILGIDQNIASKIISDEGDLKFIELDELPKEKIFRIIDGQHRIRGIEAALPNNPNLNTLPLNVVILKTNATKRSQEMEIFNTINAKSKRIKVDLIKLANFEYSILENEIDNNELNEHLSIQVAYLLNEDESPKNVWHNAIKFGIHEEEKVGIIGVNAFSESIKGLVSKYLLDTKNKWSTLKDDDMIDFARQSAGKIKLFLDDIWILVKEKWGSGFKEGSNEIDYDFEVKTYSYNKYYYLQKTLGTKSLNYLVGQIANNKNPELNALNSKNLEDFKFYLKTTKLKTSDWEMGNTFSGYSSESAFNKVTKMIKSKLDIPR
jgi:DGQHR domain-containing protein